MCKFIPSILVTLHNFSPSYCKYTKCSLYHRLLFIRTAGPTPAVHQPPQGFLLLYPNTVAVYIHSGNFLCPQETTAVSRRLIDIMRLKPLRRRSFLARTA